VAPVFDRVSLDTQSFADLGKPNRLMLRVLVRHGAPAPCSRSERRCLGSRRQRPLDTRSVGREFVLTYQPAERSPTRRPRATRDGPPEERGPIRRAAQREAVPWVHWETRGPSRPPARSAWLPEQLPGKPTPIRRTEDLPGCPYLVGRDLCFLDGREPAHGGDG
jgi:hypothetical protein